MRLIKGAEVDSPKWVSDRVGGMVGTLQHQMGYREIRVVHVRDITHLKHEFWFCTADYEENGTRLGYNRLTIQHPPDCGCELPDAQAGVPPAG